MTDYNYQPDIEKESSTEIASAKAQSDLVKELINSRHFTKKRLRALSVLMPIKPLEKFLIFEIENSKSLKGKQRDKMLEAYKSVNEKMLENNFLKSLLNLKK